MAHHLAGLDRTFLQEITNIFLTRDPREMLPSLAVQLPSPTLRDTGLGGQVEILEAALGSGNPPIVLDARELLLDPARVLQQTCERLGITFYEEMLRWPAGPKTEDGIWAKHWYHGVHASTGFDEYRPKPEPFPEALAPLLRKCLPLYEELRRHAITAGA